MVRVMESHLADWAWCILRPILVGGSAWNGMHLNSSSVSDLLCLLHWQMSQYSAVYEFFLSNFVFSADVMGTIQSRLNTARFWGSIKSEPRYIEACCSWPHFCPSTCFCISCDSAHWETASVISSVIIDDNKLAWWLLSRRCAVKV